MPRNSILENKYGFWTPMAAFGSFLPTIFAYSELFDDGERAGDECGKLFVENYWLQRQHSLVKPLCYLLAGAVVLLTIPVSMVLLAIALPIALIHDAIITLSMLADMCSNDEDTVNNCGM